MIILTGHDSTTQYLWSYSMLPPIANIKIAQVCPAFHLPLKLVKSGISIKLVMLYYKEFFT